MNNDLTSEVKTSAGATGPPAKYSLPLPEDADRCVGCPYPGVGFICWNLNGSCLRTEIEKFSCQSKGR